MHEKTKKNVLASVRVIHVMGKKYVAAHRGS